MVFAETNIANIYSDNWFAIKACKLFTASILLIDKMPKKEISQLMLCTENRDIVSMKILKCVY